MKKDQELSSSDSSGSSSSSDNNIDLKKVDNVAELLDLKMKSSITMQNFEYKDELLFSGEIVPETALKKKVNADPFMSQVGSFSDDSQNLFALNKSGISKGSHLDKAFRK